MASSNEKVLFLFESSNVLNKKAISYILQSDVSYSVVVLADYVTKSDLPISLKAISEYYDLRELREKVEEVCTSTLRSLLEDSTLKSAFTLDGLFILQLIREDLGFLLQDVIKKALVVERVISKEAPSRIVIFEKYPLLATTVPIPISKIVSLVAKKYCINITTRSSAVFRWSMKTKMFLTPFFFRKRNFKIYTLVKFKSLFWSNLRKRAEDPINVGVKKILCIPYSDAEKVAMLPVVEKLSNFEKISCVAVSYPDDDERAGLFENQWKDRNGMIPTYSFGEFCPRNMSQANSRYKEIMKVWKEKRNLFYSSEALRFVGIDLGELMNEKFETLLKCWMKDFVKYFFVTKELLRIEKPHVILTAKERWLFIRSVLEAVQQEGIPTVLIQHGIYYDSWIEHDSINVTQICVDTSYREILIKGGEDSKKIIVTGAPRYDNLFKKINEDKDSVKIRLHLNPERKYLCLLTSFLPEWSTPENRKNLLKTVIESIEKINFDLVIKLHPREKINEVQDLVHAVSGTKQIAQRVKIIDFPQVDLFDVILASDIVVGVRTSAIISALLAKKTSILINYDSSVTDFFPEIDGRIFGVAKSNNELLEMITEAITNPARVDASIKSGLEYARRYVPYEDATDRVVGCILELMKIK